MILQFSTEHIAFAVKTCWTDLDYRFKYTVNQLLQDETITLDQIHTIEVPDSILVQLFSVATVKPEGVAATINQEMQDLLTPQIQSLSNIADFLANPDTVEANEATRILLAIQQIKATNKTILDAEIQDSLVEIRKPIESI